MTPAWADQVRKRHGEWRRGNANERAVSPLPPVPRCQRLVQRGHPQVHPEKRHPLPLYLGGSGSVNAATAGPAAGRATGALAVVRLAPPDGVQVRGSDGGESRRNGGSRRSVVALHQCD